MERFPRLIRAYASWLCIPRKIGKSLAPAGRSPTGKVNRRDGSFSSAVPPVSLLYPVLLHANLFLKAAEEIVDSALDQGLDNQFGNRADLAGNFGMRVIAQVRRATVFGQVNGNVRFHRA